MLTQTRTVLFSLLIGVVSCGGAYGQAATPQDVVVSLSESLFLGDAAEVPINLSAGEGAKVGKVRSEIRYPDSGQLHFERVELSPELKAGGGKLVVGKPRNEKETRVLQVEVSGKDPLPSGMLAKITFKVLQTIIPGKFPGETVTVRLSHRPYAWDMDEKELAVVGEDGQIEFDYYPPLSSCFFYMH